jgi:hypothetical protein
MLPMGCETYRCIEHGDVVDEDILHNVNLALVLSKRADGDAVGAVAVEVLDEDVGTIGLEGHAICTVSVVYLKRGISKTYRRRC